MAALDLAVCLPLTEGTGAAVDSGQLALPLGSWARVDLAPEQPSSILADVPLLATLIDDFVEYSRPRKRAGTIEAYAKWTKAGARARVDGLDVMAIEARRLAPGICQRHHDEISASSGEATADNVAKLCSAAWTHAENRGVKLQANPWKKVKRNGSKPPLLKFPAGWLGDFVRLLDQAARDGVIEQQIADYFTLGAHTGARVWCELRTLRWEDIREIDGTINLVWSKEESRSIPIELLGVRGREVLERQRGQHPVWVWPGRVIKGKQAAIGESTVAKHWPAIREYMLGQGLMFQTIKGEPLRMHDLRHAFASYCIAELHLPKTIVAQLLGHKDQRSTDRYTHWSAEHLRAPAAEIAAGIGGTSMEAGQQERLGLDTDRLARVIREVGGTDIGAKADREVAARLGVSERTVNSWRTGEKKPPFETLHRLAKLRGCKPGFFFFGESDQLPKLRSQRAVVS